MTDPAEPAQHTADGQECAWRVWAKFGDLWAMASTAYSKEEFAIAHRDRLRGKRFLALEIRIETPEAGWIVLDEAFDPGA